MHLIDQELNLMIRGRFSEAWKIAEILQKEMPDDYRAKFNRGWFLLNQGNLQEGFQALERGRALGVYGDTKLNTTKPIWDQSDLKGKVVILKLESGYGDNIISVRFATEIHKRGGICILCCGKSLHSLFSRIEGVKERITLEQVPSTYHDFWIPGFSASWLFGHTFETLPNKPYLNAHPESVTIWKTILNSNKPKIGIRWSGNPLFEHQQFRLFPSKKIINLHKENEHLQFYSLQRDNDIVELPKDVVDLQHLLLSWEDTAACIENMDLVITSCTSIAHLSAAMGKPTWVITPILPYFVWAYGTDHSPWYQETTRVFRQEVFGEWDAPFEKIAKELEKMFPKNA